MTASYNLINYALRPAKYVERRMIFTVLQRLDRLSNVSLYRYVGFASPFYVDFRLAHRELGVQSMTNIERRETDQERFEFNRPFGFVDLEYGEAVDVLEEMDWHERSIVWLDFDGALGLDQIAAVRVAVALVPPGSVFIVSTNAHPPPIDSRLETLKDFLGDYMPFDVTDPDLLGGWSTAELYHSIIDQVVRDELKVRNAAKTAPAKLSYEQWFNFWYRDGARMLTTGGVIYDAGQAAQIAGLGIEDFAFTRKGAEAFELKQPNLTVREMIHLESLFPCEPADSGLPFLAEEDILRYRDIYRYSPRFASVDF